MSKQRSLNHWNCNTFKTVMT